ncbi:hypothetical protein FLONG3_10649 [Fusarium longipes]|uniref:Infection structure specific n=1 Tax=Fusarium longipes TaxID=694270 RepID=A0A395RLX5_9HYPO|nr:hypothetical protein FLONG3_10649 [Fusarium longipes]
MRSALVIAVGATLATASSPVVKRDAKECASLAQEFVPKLTELPTPDDSLVSFLASKTELATFTNSCEFPHITGTMADEYSSYVDKLSSWYKDQVSDVAELINACSNVPEVKSQLDSLTANGALCSDLSWVKETGSASSSSDDKKDDKKDENAAGLNTVAAGIVAAVAGLAGVMML